MSERTDFYGSNTPKCQKSPCSFQKTGCSFHSFEPILSKRAKKKSPENPLVYWTFWRRVRDSNPRFLLGTQHFECCTFDHSDNSPYSILHFLLARIILSNILCFVNKNLRQTEKTVCRRVLIKKAFYKLRYCVYRYFIA